MLQSKNEDVAGESVRPTAPVDKKWGEIPEDHFGYATDEERLNKRGLEDWELVEKIPESQRHVPAWFIGIIIMVLLVAFGLTLPFWGDRPEAPRAWFTWGHVAAGLYAIIASLFIYFMTTLYGSSRAGKLDSDKDDYDDVDMPK
ncbi:MAG: hypothetical protein CO186_02240 [Zetaproteobacteria bacterium CG_4_9_14_3_um_filter_49_83]|nr:MAG: hypothetical protein AUJ56_06285 [Zetaproteobacteria bacterium CG1_02_49_23]PIQ33496.1 MAG: hypothetical protein COW62_05005 [Zetaproteobacteria bacterium CG17_big_fil_post_rev_8_21_14_2_50_50_13]PIV30431.1 MAG: hypothetical protein COS35_06740 [Zetaproteobacteria bacterium CG02_land_8_20_14_3_00_50_9]PIY55704.1 MAG: hypothetical protein COZ00_08070 [Zetaproteobacteria bacterium CG_4_10_14_0_8_um_filter_49_80]PJA36137.1 MAG: hypothetical protein CO186_02240 [Zetaproteobacteria bacterium